MTEPNQPIFTYENNETLAITIDARNEATKNDRLRKQFFAAVRANALQGTVLLEEDPAYYQIVKTFLSDADDGDLITYKRQWGRRIIRRDSYCTEMADLALATSLDGIPSLVKNEGVPVIENGRPKENIRALIPAQIVDGVLVNIPDLYIRLAVRELSDNNTILKILVKEGEFGR